MISIAEYFRIDDHTLVEETLLGRNNALVKDAFLGDAELTLKVRTDLVWALPDRSIGVLTDLTKLFVSNASMKRLLCSLMPKDVDFIINKSDHNADTLFEALLQRSPEKVAVIQRYMRRIKALCGSLYDDILNEREAFDQNDERTNSVMSRSFMTINPAIQQSNLQVFAREISTPNNVRGELGKLHFLFR